MRLFRTPAGQLSVQQLQRLAALKAAAGDGDAPVSRHKPHGGRRLQTTDGSPSPPMASSLLAAASELQVKLWAPSDSGLMADIAAFRNAALIVAPHGAGLANMLLASENTAVIEICYDAVHGMQCPAMYAAMATNLHLPYWVTTGAGGYGTNMVADLKQLRAAVGHALRVVYSGKNATKGRRGRECSAQAR